MPPDIEQRQYVTFEAVDGLDAVPTSVRGAWRGYDYTPFEKMGDRVGENRPIPGTDGRLDIPRELDELRDSFQMKIKGRRDIDGTPYSDTFLAARINLDYLVENVFSYKPPRAVTFHRGSGLTDKVGYVTIDGWEPTVNQSSEGDHILVVVRFVIAAGSLALAGS